MNVGELTKAKYETADRKSKDQIEKSLRDLMKQCEYTQGDTELQFVRGLVAVINKTGRRRLSEDEILAALAGELADWH